MNKIDKNFIDAVFNFVKIINSSSPIDRDSIEKALSENTYGGTKRRNKVGEWANM